MRSKTKHATYPAVLGAVAGVLVTGLLLPYLVGDRSPDVSVATSGVAEGGGIAEAGLDQGEVPSGGADGVASSAGGAPGQGGSSGARSGVGGSPGGTPSSAGVGSSAEPIRLGLLILAIGSINRVGIATPAIDTEQQRVAWQTFVDDLNERGGIGGRRVEAAYSIFDVLNQDDMRAACLELTRDKKVFTVLDASGVFNGAAVLCVTQENQTPLFTYGAAGFTSDWYARSAGNLFTITQQGERHMAVIAQRLHDAGALRNKKIGILVDQGAANPRAGDSLVAELERRGHRVAHRSKLSADPSVGASQIPVEVQQMRTAGVDAVFLLTGTIYSTQFVQAGESQGYSPRYFSSDWAATTNDTWAKTMPASFDDTIAVTILRTGEWRVEQPEPPFERECREIYERRTKDRLNRGDDEHSLTIRACSLIELYRRGAVAAGPTLSRAAFVNGVQSVGQVPIATIAQGSFRPGKFDAGDLVRTLRWEFDCTCWLPDSGFSPSPY